MRDIPILIGVAALFVFGWFLMGRLDGFLSGRRKSAAESSLRVGIEDPLTAAFISEETERLGFGAPAAALRLYAADAERLAEQMRGGKLDIIFVSESAADTALVGFASAPVLLERGPAYDSDGAAAVSPLDMGQTEQEMFWRKGGCGGAADALANILAQYRPGAGNCS